MTKIHSPEIRSNDTALLEPSHQPATITTAANTATAYDLHYNERPWYKLTCRDIPTRFVLYLLSWSGFLVSFIMRNDINFAIMAMIASNKTINGNETLDSSNNSTTTSTSSNLIESSRYDKQYDWSPEVESLIKSSFYWWYVVSQVVGGIATQRFGTKSVFGWSQFATAFCSLCIPIASDLHYSLVILLRSVQGFASGLTWPAMYAVVVHWIPLSERSRFMSSFQGFSIGTGLTYPLCGYIIKYFGWPYVFYTTGSLGMIWCIYWYFLAFNTPQTHPRITQQELQFIEANKSAETNKSFGMKVPWKSIFTSWPAWAIGITTFGRIWINYVFVMDGPKFMKNILKFDYANNGILSGMPFVCSYFSAVFFCYAADKITNNKWLSLTNVRKVFTFLSQVVPGILLYAIGYITDIELLLVIWFIAVSMITASYAGAMANIVDIAPNLAGPVLAFCQTIHMSASFISPLVSGWLYKDHEEDIDSWRLIFGVACIVGICTFFVYLKFGTAEVQKWNNPKDNSNSTNTEEEERQKLQQQT